MKPISYQYFEVGQSDTSVPLDTFLQRLLDQVAVRNLDRFRLTEGRLVPRGRPQAVTDGEEEGEGNEET